MLRTLAFYAGLALLFGALPRRRPAVAMAAAVALVIPADSTRVVVKDAQMTAALTLATGIVAAFRLRRRRLPGASLAAVVDLRGYALLARSNAVFAVVPPALASTGWLGSRSVAARAVLVVAAAAAVVAVSPAITHRLLGAQPSPVERVLPIFDLAAIAHDGGTVPPRCRNVARGCRAPLLLTVSVGCAGRRCALRLHRRPARAEPAAGARLFGERAAATVANPLAYARHRVAPLNATLRWMVPFGQANAGTPPHSQPNGDGLSAHATWGTAAPACVARTLAATALGWPAVWLAASLGRWTAAGTPRRPPRDLALALFVSASAMTLSFAVVSIASDLRHHLWTMVATTVGAVVLSAAAGVPRRRVAATAAVAFVAAIGLVARIILPTGAWG